MTSPRTVAVLLCVSLRATVSHAENGAPPVSVLPTPAPLASYSEMIRKSPFAPATPAGTPVIAAAGFAANFYVSGVAKIGSKDFVTLTSRDGQTHFSLMPGETGPDGITITRVDWSEEVGKSKVTLKKGTEVGVAEFDQVALQHPVAAVPVAGSLPLPQVPKVFGGLRGPVNVNAPPPAGVRPAPQMPGVPPLTPGALDTQMQPTQQRRIRIINSRPQ